MTKYYFFGFILIVLIVILIWNTNNSKKNTIVLGKEMADAAEKEKQRVATGNFPPSPLPDSGYSKWEDEQSLVDPVENELDDTIIQLCSNFKECTEEKRNEIRGSLSEKDIYTLLEFSKRATIFSIRKEQASYIQNGVIAIAMIEADRCDYRDILMTMGFLNYGIQKLNLNSTAIYEEAERFSEEKTGKLIRGFSQKNTKDLSLERMSGYTTIETSKGISFIQTGYNKYNPKKNLAKILFNISDYISGDKYQKGNISIGDKISSIWLSADKNQKIESIISSANGCAYLSAMLRKQFHPKSGVQMFSIYLTEFEDKESLQVLLEQVNRNKPTDFCRLSFVEGNIFCVVIQRAIMVGVENFETDNSLKRFEEPFRKLISKD